MTLWIEDKAVEGPGVRALVIGVSDYEFLPAPGQLPQKGRETLNLTKVDIPATSAFRIAKWLRNTYWHPTHKIKTIRLLVSPTATELNPPIKDPVLSQEERAELAAVAKNSRATTDNVRAALKAWQTECRGNPEDIALLYIAGHGIHWGNPNDAIVLLEDFAREDEFLNFTLGISGVVRGMLGNDMPQLQLYFVDSCRINPDEHAKFLDAGSPLGLRSKIGAEFSGSAPIYYAASPQSKALGRIGRGTYFAEALIDCLQEAALQPPNENSSLLGAHRHWHINVASLAGPLSDRIRQIAGKDGKEQHIAPGGTQLPAVFSAREQPPPVTIVVDIDPDEVAKVTFAQLLSQDETTEIMARTRCWERPLKVTKEPASYLLRLTGEQPEQHKRFIIVNALPPQWHKPIKLS